jgi:hypothetical protein
LPHEPLPTWDTEPFFGIFEGLRRNFTTIFCVVLCPKQLLVIDGNYDPSKKIFTRPCDLISRSCDPRWPPPNTPYRSWDSKLTYVGKGLRINNPKVKFDYDHNASYKIMEPG